MITASTHYTMVPGTTDHLQRYLEENGSDYRFVYLPLEMDSGLPIKLIERANGNKKELHRPRVGGPVGDALYSQMALLRKKTDMFIGLDPVNFVEGYLVTKIRNPHAKTVFYSVDYSPHRFSNPILNLLYRASERFSMIFSDNVWTVSEHMREVRMGEVSDKNKVVLVPNGSWKDAHLTDVGNKHGPIEYVYIGTVNRISGVAKFVQMAKDSKTTINIIGEGDAIKEVKALGNDNVVYHGLLKNDAVLDLLSEKRWVGIAPYNLDQKSHTLYGFSLKIVEYLTCGLPIICPNWVEPANDVQASNSGFVYDDDSKLPQIIKEVDAMTPSQYTSLSERATMTGRKYYWPIIYDQAFEMKG